jgi:release factor glutamine methyltransferase
MACDESEEALWIARQNAVRHHVSVSFHRGDWLQAIADDVLHVVVSNPPYIAPDDEHLPALSYEPHSALVAGNEGYADIMQIATQAFRKLQSGGRFYVEHGFQQAERVREILTAAGFMQVGTARDYAGLERFSYGVKAVDE